LAVESFDTRIEEVLPGLVHWRAFHPRIRRTVHSTLLTRTGTLIDPMEPAGGLEAIAAQTRPRRIVLSNRHHYRDSAAIAKRFGCPVFCHEAGLHEFEASQAVHGFAFGDAVAADAIALELASITPEETALLLDVGAGALSFADGLTRAPDGSLAFMPDELLGDEPEQVRRGLTGRLTRMLDEDFETLLFAHAEPVESGGRDLLRAFLAPLDGA
jgi:hypothetical protein